MKQQGMTRNQAVNFIDAIKSNQVEKKTVLNILRHLKTSGGNMSCPDCVKIGDIFYNKGLLHYAVVLSIKKGNAISVLLTSSKTENPEEDDRPHILGPTKSRFVDSLFTYTTIISTVEEVDRHFVGVYDNTTHLRSVKSKIKKYYKRFINRC